MQYQNKPKSNYTNTGDKMPQRKTITSDSTQNLWCRDTMWDYVAKSLGRNAEEIFSQRNGCHLRSCNKSSSECRGAHSLSELKPLPHIAKYNSLNKGTFNWIKLYLNVLKTMQRDLPNVKKEEHKRFVSSLSTMNFIELIQLWRNMACYYNKAAKELPFKKDIKGQTMSVQECGFAFRDDVPNFRIGDDLEDHAWSFERLTRYCPVNEKFEGCIKCGTQITIWDLCLATGLNCKEGVHKKCEMLCTEDFLNGTCSCKSQEQIDTETVELQKQLIEVSNELVAIVENEKAQAQVSDNDGWSKPKAKKPNNKFALPDPKIKLRQEINRLENEIKNLESSRFIHYSDLGMKPFKNLLEEHLAQEKIKEETKQPEPAPVEPKKADWDHGLVETGKINGSVAKVTKFGKKK